MTDPAPPIVVSACDHCHNRFVARPGACPRCGSLQLSTVELPATAVVLAATQLESPPSGWPAPHRLALVELEESVRVLALVDGDLPALASTVTVRRDGDRFHVAAS